MYRVGVLGSTGMLGSTLTKLLESENYQISEFNRKGISVTGQNATYMFDVAMTENLDKLLRKSQFDYVINCIGIIKQLIDEDKHNSIKMAIQVNSEFPARLDELSLKYQVPIITIGTDCVYSGKVGRYSELDKFDPIDHYGKTKSLGEGGTKNTMIIRCSVIGREVHSSNSLMEWILSQQQGKTVHGFINHIWNGVTTLHFSQVVSGIMQNNNFKPGTIHLVPSDKLNKFELLKVIAQVFGRHDINIHEFEANNSIDRSLITTDFDRNSRFWCDAGYNKIPTIKEMLLTYQTWSSSK